MPAPQDTAESAEPPASATRGAEIAPLVEAEPSPAERLRKAREEIEDADEALNESIRASVAGGAGASSGSAISASASSPVRLARNRRSAASRSAGFL